VLACLLYLLPRYLSLSFYTMHVPGLISITVSTYSCMPVLTTQFSMHDYDSDLSIHVCLSIHATWHSHHHSPGSTDSSASSCPGLGA